MSLAMFFIVTVVFDFLLLFTIIKLGKIDFEKGYLMVILVWVGIAGGITALVSGLFLAYQIVAGWLS